MTYRKQGEKPKSTRVFVNRLVCKFFVIKKAAVNVESCIMHAIAPSVIGAAACDDHTLESSAKSGD